MLQNTPLKLLDRKAKNLKQALKMIVQMVGMSPDGVEMSGNAAREVVGSKMMVESSGARIMEEQKSAIIA